MVTVAKKQRNNFANQGLFTHSCGFSCSHIQMRELGHRNLSAKELMLLNCAVGEESGESLGLQGDQTRKLLRKSVLNIHCKD